MKILTIIVLITGAAQAQPQCTNLIYTGAPFVSLVTSGSNAQSLVPFAGTVTLSTPLPANAQNVAISPTAWQFNSESPNLNSEYTYELIGWHSWTDASVLFHHGRQRQHYPMELHRPVVHDVYPRDDYERNERGARGYGRV